MFTNHKKSFYLLYGNYSALNKKQRKIFSIKVIYKIKTLKIRSRFEILFKQIL